MKTSSTKLTFGVMFIMFSLIGHNMLVMLDDLSSGESSIISIFSLALLFGGVELLHSYFKNMLKDYGGK